jgi:hypothetical protein
MSTAMTMTTNIIVMTMKRLPMEFIPVVTGMAQSCTRIRIHPIFTIGMNINGN